MVQKTLKFLVAIFAFVLFANVVSSLAITDSTLSGTKLNQTQGYLWVTVDSVDPSLQLNNYSDLSVLTFGTPIKTNTTTHTTFNISYNTNGYDFDLFDNYFIKLSVSDSSTTTANLTWDFAQTTYCYDNKNEGKLKLDIEEVNILSGYGDEDDFWFLRDVVEIELVVENTGNWDIEKIEIEWELYTKSGKLIMDGEEKRFNLDEDDDITIVFNFKLDEDMDDFDGEDAILYVRAIGLIDDSKANDNDGDQTCATDNTGYVQVIVDDDFVIVDDFKVNSNSLNYDGYYGTDLACGSEVTVSGKLWNIGEDTQDDVILEIYSSALGIDERMEYSRIKGYGSQDFSYTFNIPKNIDEKAYQILFEVFDEDEDLFENSEDGTSARRIYLKVAGQCKVEAPGLSAKLVEETVVEGKTMTIKTNVQNNNNHAVIYTFAVEGFEDWAKLNSIQPEALSLLAGENGEITFNFEVRNKMEGERTFKINVYQNGEIVATQPLSLNVEASSFKLGKVFEKETLQIIGIVLINILLVVAIIIVARRILSKK